MQTATYRWPRTLGGSLLMVVLVAGCSGKPQPAESSRKPAQAAPAPPVQAETPEPAPAPPPPPPPSVATPKKATMPPHAAEAAPPARPKAARRQLYKSVPPAPTGAAPPPDAEQDKILYSKVPAAQQETEDATENDHQYTVVKVYYATDRSPLDVGLWRQSLRGGWPIATGICAIFTAALILWRPTGRGRWAISGLAGISLLATVVLGGLTLAYQWQPAAKDKPIERMYGGDRGELELGTCQVSVPKDHRLGALESPTVLRLEFREDPERHVVLLGVHPESAKDFYADLRGCMAKTARKEAFVFVHGYNVGFETAVRRTAQIAYDLKFEGAPIVYSWPSQEGLLSYTVDETNVAWTVPHLKEFLVGIAEQSGAKSVHLVAHSMGNRALTSALRELAMERREACPRFHEIVLTAPDIDADVFRRDIAPAILGTADRVTLYASSNDEALIASRAVHGYHRAGESGDKVMVVPGVDTVDVSEVDTSLIGHSYYGSNSTVLADLFELMQGSKPPDQRKWLRSTRLGALTYWKFLREQAGDSVPPGEEL